MDYASRQGRGIGKTSFLIYERGQINSDWGDKQSHSQEVIFSVYITPPLSEQKKFWQICRFITKAFIEQDLIGLAMCRLRYFYGGLSEKILSKIETLDVFNSIGDWAWINNQYTNNKAIDDNEKISEFDSNYKIKNHLLAEGIDVTLVDRLVRFGFSSNDFTKFYFDGFKDTDWKKSGPTILFEDFLKFFKAAGFTKGIILFDELEKVVQYQNVQERRTFCDELRYWFIDGSNSNTKLGFYSALFVIHPYLQEILNPYWSSSGLERFGPLGGSTADDFTIFFRPIEEEDAVPLAAEYLKAFRLEESNDPIYPFTRKALITANINNDRVPGKYLNFLHSAIEKAIDENWSKIDIAEIEQVSAIGFKEEDITSDSHKLTETKTNLNDE
jgi:hypothetical protein